MRGDPLDAFDLQLSRIASLGDLSSVQRLVY